MFFTKLYCAHRYVPEFMLSLKLKKFQTNMYIKKIESLQSRSISLLEKLFYKTIH